MIMLIHILVTHRAESPKIQRRKNHCTSLSLHCYHQDTWGDNPRRFDNRRSTEWMLWWRGHRPPWQRREWSSFKQQALKKRSSLKTHPFSIADIPTLMQIATAKCAPLGKRVFWSSHPLNSKHRQLFCRRTSTKVTNEYAMVNSLPTIL